MASTVPTQRSVKPSWHRLDSGIVIPDGVSSHVERSESDTYLRLKEKAISLEGLYERRGVPLPVGCDLAGLIADAKNLSDGWLTNDTQGFSVPLLVRVGHLDRIASAALLLDGTPSCSDFLGKLATGSLDLAARTRSNAKDVLWELEFWAILRRNSSTTELIEPPDIVVRFDGAEVGIACKKLYSEKNTEKVLSQAVGQIEASFDFGIVAMNLDDLMPPGKMLRVPNYEALGRVINDLNIEFLHRHERHFRKYLSTGRVISAVISTAIAADLYEQRPRFHTARQTTIWTIPGLSDEKSLQLRQFYHQVMGA